ncbi:hypothetical protein GCM10007047_05890 [Cerasicoccus arenae]|uniref:Uncharacterized protein n=2 Tax=Cerasicoccus arenae TaxID=424488 RepID=A0A8J3D7W0_9BACT|nr:hypothetical protein GCM10007047_05890 [Cerasicoccus arenae]
MALYMPTGGFFMILEWFSALEGVASLATLLVLLWQIGMLLRQLRFNAVLHIYDINRDLIGRALDDPDLRKVLDGEQIADASKEKRYFQLWINQIKLIHLGWRSRFLPRTSWPSLQKDIGDFTSLPRFQTNWKEVSQYYSGDFREFLEETKRKMSQ